MRQNVAMKNVLAGPLDEANAHRDAAVLAAHLWRNNKGVPDLNWPTASSLIAIS